MCRYLIRYELLQDFQEAEEISGSRRLGQAMCPSPHSTTFGFVFLNRISGVGPRSSGRRGPTLPARLQPCMWLALTYSHDWAEGLQGWTTLSRHWWDDEEIPKSYRWFRCGEWSRHDKGGVFGFEAQAGISGHGSRDERSPATLHSLASTPLSTASGLPSITHHPSPDPYRQQ